MSENVNLELAAILPKLGPDERKQVLEYARSLRGPEDTPRPSLMEFVGCISKEDGRLMLEAIEEMFERVP
jgi:hypothetical protein